MKNKNNIPDNLENEASILSKIKKENHFSTPKNYFEVLPEMITSKNLNNNKLQFNFDKLSYRILVPVSVFALLFFIVFNFSNNNTENELTNEQLSELIIEEEYIEFDDYLVYDTYAEIIEEEENEALSETDTYIDYLIENDIDINSIIEEL
ncbi:MAG: hypothetical protein JKX68_05555 [Flavobacteriales bacterium]|nr:hypothetical protein [Flavobacteriales bacterium]